MIYLLTDGKTWIKTHEEVEALTSTTDHWLHKRYSNHLIAVLFKIISTKSEERPTAKEIRRETLKNKRQDKPELMIVNRLEEFIALQEQLVALLPKMGYQRKGETITYLQWSGWFSERIEGLRKQAGGESEGGVVNVGDSIDKLSGLLKRLQDQMTSADLATACSLFRSIEEMAQIKE